MRGSPMADVANARAAKLSSECDGTSAISDDDLYTDTELLPVTSGDNVTDINGGNCRKQSLYDGVDMLEQLRQLPERPSNSNAVNIKNDVDKQMTWRNWNDHSVAYLRQCIKNLDYNSVECCINDDTDLAALDEVSGDSVLHTAAAAGEPGVVLLILQETKKRGLSFLNCANVIGDTPLHICCRLGNIRVAQMLVDFGADINATNVGGWSILHAACQSGEVILCAILIERGAAVNASAKWLECQWGFGSSHLTPLDVASSHGYDELIRFLINCGASVCKHKSKGGRGPYVISSDALHHASLADDAVDAAKILLENGASAACLDENSRTPLHWAARSGNIEVAKLLLATNVAVDAVDVIGNTPLHFASMAGHAPMCDLLLRHQADSTLENKFGMRALFGYISPLDLEYTILSGRCLTDNELKQCATSASVSVDTLTSPMIRQSQREATASESGIRMQSHERATAISLEKTVVVRKHGAYCFPDDDLKSKSSVKIRHLGEGNRWSDYDGDVVDLSTALAARDAKSMSIFEQTQAEYNERLAKLTASRLARRSQPAISVQVSATTSDDVDTSKETSVESESARDTSPSTVLTRLFGGVFSGCDCQRKR